MHVPYLVKLLMFTYFVDMGNSVAHKFKCYWLLEFEIFSDLEMYITEKLSSHRYVHVFVSSLLEIRLKIEWQKYLDDGMCDDIGHILIIRSDPIDWSKW